MTKIKKKIHEKKNELRIVELKSYLVENDYTILGRFANRKEAEKFLNDYPALKKIYID